MRKLHGLSALPFLLAIGCEEPALLEATYALCAAPESLSFGDQAVRTASTLDVTVTNCGTARIDKLTASLVFADEAGGAGAGGGAVDARGAFSVVATDVPVPLVPGAQFTLPLRFRPKELGAHATTLVVNAIETGGTAEVRVAVDGTGVPLAACDILVGPDPVEFGAVLLEESVERDVTFTNQGSAPCQLSGARVTLEHDEFFEITAPPPTEVAPGASVSATLRFAPRDIGAREGRLAVVLSADGVDDSELTVALTGTGVSRDRCALQAEPSPLALPRTSLGLASATEASAIVRSVGELPCALTSLAITDGADELTLVDAPAAGTVLNPADSSTLTVRFAPLTAGPRAGTVSIETDDGAVFELLLTAFADPAPSCALVFEPATVSFAPLAVGLSAEADVTFRNASSVDCALTSSSLAPGSEPDFAIVDASALGIIAPGAQRSARIRFTAQLAAPALGRLNIALENANGDDVVSSVDLLGFGNFAELVLVPGFHACGVVTQGCVSDVVDLTLTNVGPVAARIDDIGFTPATDPNFELLDDGGAAGVGVAAGGELIAPGATRVLQARMRGAPLVGSHYGELEVRATGTRDAFERAVLTGSTDSVENATRTDSFTQRERPIIDILFVVDNSGSMSQEQANLATNFGAFIQFTSELDIDYQLGVVTTEGSGANAGRLRGPIITNSGPNPTPDPVAAFVAQANVGTNGSADEEGLNAAVLALTEPRISQAPNAGFLRDGALLSVIFVSDEEDHSAGDVGGYLDALLAVKSYDADAVIASAIAGDVPSGCESLDGDADAAARYFDVVTALQGVFASICAPNWATTMEEIGLGTFQALTRFQLSREPDPATMVVTVDGVPVPASELNGWEYDAETNSVRFNGTAVPAAGQQIEITYTAECLVDGGAP